MYQIYPYINEWWEDKRANIKNITVPAYILASYSTFLHTFGSFRGYREIPHSKKWLALTARMMIYETD
jgi:predicted acyl esterase